MSAAAHLRPRKSSNPRRRHKNAPGILAVEDAGGVLGPTNRRWDQST